MKKSLLYICAVGLLSVPTVNNAQNRSKGLDNFGTQRGVVIVTPTLPPIAPPVQNKKGENKKLVKKTAAVSPKTMPVQDGLSLKNSPLANYGRISMGTGTSMSGFTTGDATIDSHIVASSARYKIDPLLIYAQMHQESSFKLKATSYKGARGLMQLMPATAIRMGVTDIYNPKQNIEGGIKYMRWLLDKFGGDVALALAGYNAGEGAVMKYGNQIPPYRETQEYVRRISARYNSITNPNLAKIVRKVSETQAAKLEKKVSAPLTTFERSSKPIRLPDGKMMLVN